MGLFVFFGLPGAGKSFVGSVAEKYFGFYVYDGDLDLTQELHSVFNKQAPVTDDMRDVFFSILIESIKKQLFVHKKLIVTQTFIKEKYREQFLSIFPQAKFILVEADTRIREKRLEERKSYHLEKEYARKMVQLFDPPQVDFSVLHNTKDGEDFIKAQLEKLLA